MSVTRQARKLAYHERLARRTHGDTRFRHQAEAKATAEQLRRDKQCLSCGTPLQDPVSVERGYGPDCWAKKQGKGSGLRAG